MNEIDIQVVINDQMDICVRICKKEEDIYDENGIRFDRHSIEKNLEEKRIH